MKNFSKNSTEKESTLAYHSNLKFKLLNQNPLPNFNIVIIRRLSVNSPYLVDLYQNYLLLCLCVLEKKSSYKFDNLIILTKKVDIEKENYILVTSKRVYIYLNKTEDRVRVALSKFTSQIIRNVLKLIIFAYPDQQIHSSMIFNNIINETCKTILKPMTKKDIKKRILFLSKQYFNESMSIKELKHLAL